MLWAGDGDGGGDAAADFRALQRKQEEYARELDRQIAARRAAQAQEQQAREELERKLRPGAHSPAKWLAEGGRVDDDAWGEVAGQEYRQSQLQQQRGAETGEPVGAAASPFTRFRVTDESASDRLRERAQQLEWRRVLDEQVRENARLRAAQEEQRRHGERAAAEEEMRFLREQQLRAQRKLGYPSPSPAAPTVSRVQYQPIPSPQQHELEAGVDASAAFRASARRRFQINDSEQAETPTLAAGNPYAGVNPGGVSVSVLPPAAPTRLHMKSNFASPNDSSDYARNGADGDARSAYEYSEQSRHEIIEQYRGLLSEIRREREELRREREEMRREKEELRIQRALLELENEKMASLVDAQRRLAEQQMERQQREAHALAQQQHQQQMELAMQRADVLPADDGALQTPARRASTPPRFGEYSRVDQLRQSLVALNVVEAGQPATPQRRASPMSMAEFAAPRVPRQTPFVADSPVYQRRQSAAPYQRSQVAWVDEVAEQETPLDQSLVGESVFVPVEPAAPLIAATTSPRAQRADPRSPLRNSRVIKSRGFYDLDQAYETPAPSRQRPRRFQRRSSPPDDLEEHKYGHDEVDQNQREQKLDGLADNEDEESFEAGLTQANAILERLRFADDGSWASISDFGEDELRGLDDEESEERRQRHTGGSGGDHEDDESRRSPAASGLFQVQVLM